MCAHWHSEPVAHSQWHKFYEATVAAPAEVLFDLRVRELGATIDVHIHYSLEAADGATRVGRWLVLDIAMPVVARPLRGLIISGFDGENARTMAALAAYAESHR
jgi:hypothetical protein